MTFSVTAFEPDTASWGVAATTRFIAVGGVLPWIKAGVGVIASQAMANMDFGLRGLKLLEDGKTSQETLEILRSSDPGRETRQLSIIGKEGQISVYTGKECVPSALHVIGKNFSAQGNMLSKDSVVHNTAAYMEENSDLDLPDRMLGALKAGQKSGGDRRGRESAVLMVVSEKHPYLQKAGFVDPTRTWVNLRVDHALDPLGEMERLLRRWKDVFYDDKMVDLGNYWTEIEKALRSKGYNSLEQWAFNNNFSNKVSADKISSVVLERLLG